MSNKWDIIQTFHNEPIHLDHLKKSNPKANILLANISKYNADFKIKYRWRNSDIFIRRWIRDNRKDINSANIAIIEWDVLITQKLPDLNINGLLGKNIQYQNNWYWFKESHLLGKYQQYSIGITPLCILFMDQKCIDAWIDPEFDVLYSSDIFCELRLPTILNSRGIKISRIPLSLPNVSTLKSQYKNIPDIYHPIKEKIYTTGT